MKLGEMILDTDICIEIGSFKKLQLIEKIIPLIAEKAYMHRYVYEKDNNGLIIKK